MAGLLYDHLMTHAAESGDAPDVLAALRDAPAYEITNILGLFDDWEEAAEKEIPRRPPHNHLWCEWIREDFQDAVQQFGSLVDNVTTMKRNENFPPSWNDYDELWSFYGFKKTLKLKENVQLSRLVCGRLFVADHAFVVGLKNDGKEISRQLLSWPFTKSVFGLDLSPSVDYESTGSAPGVNLGRGWDYSWPALMAFSLLHCRNVSTEIVKPDFDPHAERRRNRGLPAKKAYHVLRLELPNNIRPHAPTANDEEAERRMRFHLCRGHFKNLQHERYKEKGWHWWPAHWKGSKEIGVIDKRYELHKREDKGTNAASE